MCRVETGVPQGSILGLLLFLIYINDLPNSVNSKLIIYADDAILIGSERETELVRINIEKETARVIAWAASSKLLINSSKTQCILFSGTKPGGSRDQFIIKIKDTPMNTSNFVKYLGVLIDNQLNFKHHTAMVAKKLSVAAGVINKIKHYIPRVMLKSIYYSIAYPHLIYCVTIWGNTLKTYLYKIQVQQNRITEVLNKAPTFRVKLASINKQFSILKRDKVFTL